MRVLVVGLGGIGQRHVRNLRALLGTDIEILAWRTRGLEHVLSDRLTVESGDGLEQRYDIRRVASLDEGLVSRPDAVFVTNPSSLHVPVALEAARAGCHLFIEKPLSDSLDGSEELLALTEAKGLVTQVGYQLRFHPLLRAVAERLECGAIGRLLAARLEVGEHLPGFHPYEDYRQLYASRRDLGGGVILSQIHELDIAYWLFGLPHRLFAVGGHLSGLEIDVEDTASILMECRREGRPLPVHVQQDYCQRPPSRTIEVVGEGGKIVVDLHTLELRLIRPEGQVEMSRLEAFERNYMFLDEQRHFLACVRGEARPLVPVREGLQSLRMALAAHRSLATGQAVEP